MEREFSAGGVLVKRIKGVPHVAAIRPGGKPAGVWALPKGNLDPGEKPDETALREVWEETGVRGRLVEKLGDVKYTYTRPGGIRVFKIVSFYLLSAGPGRLGE
ncbi:MAG: NUDIX domain-containing protein, partial [Gaiellaceae bacterium]